MEYLQLLRNRHFDKLWIAQILSQVGQNLLNFSLIILVFNLVVNSKFENFAVSLVVLAFSLPALLFASVAGTYVDYWDRKKVLVVTNVLRATLVLLYMVVNTNLALILLLTFMISSIMQLFFPAESATIPNIVPRKLLLPANSLFIFTIYAAFMVGYSGSGPVVQVLGPRGPFEVVAVMTALAALLTAFLPKQGRAQPNQRPPKFHLINDLRANLSLVREHPGRLFSVLQLTITQGMVSVLVTLAPALSKALLHLPLQDSSHIIIIPVGVGMVIGVILINSLGRRVDKATLIQGGLIVAGICLTALGLSGQLYRIYHGNTIVPIASIAVIVAVLMLMLGLINAVISAAAQTLLQETTSDHNRGKVFASLNMMINLSATLPILFVGALADLLSVTQVITLLGGGLTLYALYMVWHYRPQIHSSEY